MKATNRGMSERYVWEDGVREARNSVQVRHPTWSSSTNAMERKMIELEG